MSDITITGYKWCPNDNRRLCDKLEVFVRHDDRHSWYMLDIYGGKNKRDYRVQSATCIPLGGRAMPRNVTGKMPKIVATWVNDFLTAKSAEGTEARPGQVTHYIDTRPE